MKPVLLVLKQLLRACHLTLMTGASACRASRVNRAGRASRVSRASERAERESSGSSESGRRQEAVGGWQLRARGCFPCCGNVSGGRREAILARAEQVVAGVSPLAEHAANALGVDGRDRRGVQCLRIRSIGANLARAREVRGNPLFLANKHTLLRVFCSCFAPPLGARSVSDPIYFIFLKPIYFIFLKLIYFIFVLHSSSRDSS